MESDIYRKVRFLGRGTYGEVWMCQNIVTHESVAVKKIKVIQEGEGIHITALREIMVLQEFDHPNIIKLKDMFYKDFNMNLVLELCEHALNDVIPKIKLTEEVVKSIMKQLLEGLAYLHDNFVVHRDLKPGNILISHKGELKITDFGTAKLFGENKRPLTNGITTLWYSAPELLFGTKHYGSSIDMWAAGCILAELLNRQPLFPGQNGIDQLSRIFNTLGTPSAEDWPGVNYLPNYFPHDPSPQISFRHAFPSASPNAIDLMKSLLSFSPSARITANQALKHAFFTSEPAPLSPIELAQLLR